MKASDELINEIVEQLRVLNKSVELADTDSWSGEYSDYDITSSFLAGFWRALEMTFDEETIDKINSKLD